MATSHESHDGMTIIHEGHMATSHEGMNTSHEGHMRA